MQCTTLSLYRFDRLRDRAWVLGQMALARPALGRLAGLEFVRLCGSGTGEGFTPRPNTAVWAILAVWSEPRHARAALSDAPVLRRWSARATEACTLFMEPLSARGEWGGRNPLRPTGARGMDGGPLAVLTRATIRPRHLLRFWSQAPDVSARIGANPDVMLKIGIGEVPWLHQVTFSIWPDAERMARFARTGPHADAIAAVRAGDWFSEELYARFRVTGAQGRWQGVDPLQVLEAAA